MSATVKACRMAHTAAPSTRQWAGARLVAQAMGRPNAARAVGRANGDNRIAIVIPCHRVVGGDGRLAGYGGGLWRKRALLDLELRAVGAAPARLPLQGAGD